MSLRNLTVALTGAAAAALITPAMALIPVQVGALYAFHTDAKGACHGTDWYLYIDGDQSIDGYAAWDRGHERATVTGQIYADGSIRSVGQMMGSTRKAAITGQLYDHYFTITVDGTGTPCDGQSWKVPRQSWTGAETLGGGG